MALPPNPDETSNPNEWIQLAIDRLGTDLSYVSGDALQAFLNSQTHLITSLPLEAARRAQELALEAVLSNDAEGLVEKMGQLGDITRSRAALIARTEVSRTASAITQLRAMSMRSRGYIWRTLKDSLVRPEHQALEGAFILWGRPPLAGGGLRYHAGQGPNCRCFMEVVLREK